MEYLSIILLSFFELSEKGSIMDCLEKRSPIFALLSVLFGLISILFGLYSIFSALKLSGEVKSQSSTLIEQSEKMKTITESLSTKFVDEFPNQMDTIIDYINLTKNKLLMVLDFPAYGCVSNPNGYVRFRNSLDKLMSLENIEVTLISYIKDKQLEQLQLQFDLENVEEQIREDHKKKITSFAKKFNLEEIKTYKQLFDELLKRNEELFNKFKENSQKVYLTDLELTMFLWLIDEDKSGLFSFYTRGLNSNEVTFSTEDRNVLDHMKHLSESIIRSDKTRLR